MSRHIEIEIVNRHCTFVRGYRSRDAITTVLGKPPVWSTVSRAWVCSERTARELLLPHLEHLGIDVVITGPRVAAVAASSPPASDQADPGRGLW